MGIYMGLDLSLTASGVSKLKGEEHSALVLKSNKKGVHRLKELKDKIDRELVMGGRPTFVALEGYAMGAGGGRGGNSGRVFDIGEWGGIVRLLLLEREIPTILVPPKTLKMFVTHNGNAGKPDMIKAVRERWGIVTKDDNIADAYGLAYLAEMFHTGIAGKEVHPKEVQALNSCKQIVWQSSKPRVRKRSRV